MSAWRAQSDAVTGGYRYRVVADNKALTFRQLFDSLRSDGEFADWYSKTLAAFKGDAFYWELPPLTRTTIDNEAEFVLIDAPILARIPAEPAPFADHFRGNPEDDVIVFPNLGGDAILIVPSPRGAADAYPHLAAFLRRGDAGQVRSLWRVTAETVLDQLNDVRTWISTAGGGVFWLHLRLDSRPKYYQHRAYAVQQ